MSFKLLDEFNSELYKRYGDGIEEIVLPEVVYKQFITEATGLRRYDLDSAGKFEESTNLKYHGTPGVIILTKSVKDKIKETEEQITQLQDKLIKLKTRTGF